MIARMTEIDPPVAHGDDASDEEQARRRQVETNQPLIALIDSWLAEGENATDEERRSAEAEWEQFFREFEPLRLREYHHEP